MTRVAEAMLCVQDVVLGKELTFLYPAGGPAARAIYAARLARGSVIEPILSKIGERELLRSS
jgi:hypothetical protein